MTAILKITDGVTSVSLLNGENGFFLNAWRPAIPQYKGGGVWQNSPLSDGRRLVTRQFENTIETFDLKLAAINQDELIRYTQDLRRLLEKAVDHWATDWQVNPVWIEAQATCESNIRYALIHSYSTPDDDNPFNSPFLMQRSSAMDNWTLVLERGHWLADEPTTSTCVQVSGTQDDSYASETYEVTASTDDCYVLANNVIYLTTTYVQFGNFGGVVSDAGIIFRNLEIEQGATIGAAFIRFVATSTLSNQPVALLIKGQDTSEPQTFSTATDFINRPRTSTSVTWNITVTWTAFNSYDTPSITTIIQEIVNRDDWEYGDDICIFIEDDGSANDYYRRGASWDEVTYDPPVLHIVHYGRSMGRDATCENEVYIANKQNKAQLTHLFVDNGGAFGSNLLEGALPYDLLPAVPAVNDAVYFGSATTITNSGPFFSLVFDLSVPVSDVTTIAWEYYNGAWVALTPIQDNTDADGLMSGVAFDTTGVKSVHWEPTTDWTSNTVNAISAYWVRARVTAIGASPSAPTQQNRHVYTITWPSVKIESDEVGGDIPALLQINSRNESDGNFGSGGSSELYANRLIVGIRALSRGSDFTSFINLSDEQNHTGITITASGTGLFANDISAPTGRIVQCTNPAASWGNVATIAFDSDIGNQYRGRFHAYLRVDQTSGSANDISARLNVSLSISGTAIGGITRTTDSVVITSTAKWHLVDLGSIVLPPSTIIGSDIFEMLIAVQLYGNAASDINLYDLILVPVDEWAGDFSLGESSGLLWGGRRTSNSTFIDVDAITRDNRVLIRRYSDDLIAAALVPLSNGEFILQSNTDQRVWFLPATSYGTGDLRASPALANTVQVWTVQRYLSMRGDR